MEIEFVTSVSPIVADPPASAAFYRDRLGIGFEGAAGDYVFTDALSGVKHFGVWPLSEAAEACFGTPVWPDHLRVPQASIEFEVADVAAAAAASSSTTPAPSRGARSRPGSSAPRAC